jgi:NAD(P)-dependent dehydrogenase (short-subunit alcohol dehydrogenase family)
MQFAINHLGHFALAVGLHDALRAAGSARIVSVSSSAHLRSPVVFDDIQFASRAYEPLLAYGQSKTANVLFVVGATSGGRTMASPPTLSCRGRSPPTSSVASA